MSHWAEFGHVVVNEDFGEAVSALSSIVRGQGEPWRADRPDVAARVNALLA
jgi:guanylate kinase